MILNDHGKHTHGLPVPLFLQHIEQIAIFNRLLVHYLATRGIWMQEGVELGL